MRRRLYDRLLQWKKERNRPALLIEGARRVGKSYLAEEFGRKEYSSCLLIDFARPRDGVEDVFERFLNDLDNFFRYLSALYGVPLYPGESLIIFDEVQLYPKARGAIKYLVGDGRFDYLETGSLMSIRKNVEGILIPSEERSLTLCPMSFEEFAWACDATALWELASEAFSAKRGLGQALHRKLMDLFRQYLVVGGMPQAVQAFVDGASFEEIDRVKRDVLSLYRRDISRHARGYESKVAAVFDEVPAQLQRHEKRFNLASLRKGARFRDYEEAIFWLTDAMIVNACFAASEPSLGLRMKMDGARFKCYMGDTGLLISHAFDERELIDEALYQKLLLGKLEFNEGMIFENIVAQMLFASGRRLYYYSQASKDRADRMEIDFLIASRKTSNRHNVSPIEVKSSRYNRLSSLNKFRKKFAQELAQPYVVHTGDFKEEDGIVFLPAYMVPFL